MRSTFDDVLRRLLAHEGGYSNHPSDPGGPTNFGITLADYRAYVKADATADDVRGMSIETAKAIYRARYAKPLRYDDLPVGLDYAVFDYGVNSGIGRAAKVLQRLVSVPDDGIVGPLTIAAVRGRDPKALIAAICDERLRFLQSLRIWPVFGAGWRRRVEEVRAVALAMADARPLAQRPTPVARGKGHVTRPRGPLSSGLLSVVAAAIALQDWVAAHPLVAAALGGLVLGGSMVATRVWHRATFDRRQQAATPAVAAIPLSKGTVS